MHIGRTEKGKVKAKEINGWRCSEGKAGGIWEEV